MCSSPSTATALKVMAYLNFSGVQKKIIDEYCFFLFDLTDKSDIVWVKEDPDVILICGQMPNSPEILKRPHIFLDDTDTASIPEELRKYFKNPNMLAIFKNTILRPKELYNKASIYHAQIIEESYSNSKPAGCCSKLSDNELKKIHNVLWDGYHSPFRQDFKSIAEYKINFDTQRQNDVFFAANTPGSWQGYDYREKHRAMLCKKLETIKKFKIILHSSPIPHNEYIELLKNSKIVISPWGWGEWCYRDYEAIYCGAILIKPDTSFVQSIPDLYQNYRYYVPCKADFSDLEEKISYILANYEKFIDMRKMAHDLLISHWNYEKIAHDFAQAIQNLVNNNRNQIS